MARPSRATFAALAIATIVVLGLLRARAPTSAPPEPPPPGTVATVVSVVDGDTITARMNGTDGSPTDKPTDRPVTVRLIGIDTPETKRPATPVECFGPEASARTKELLPEGTEIVLEADVEPTDRYGRTLAYVHRRGDGLFVNLELVRTGHAASYPYPPNVAHLDELEAAATDARAARQGLWSACGSPHRRR